MINARHAGLAIHFTTRLAPIAPAEGCARWNEINIRPMYAVQDSFKHWTAARRRIDYPIRFNFAPLRTPGGAQWERVSGKLGGGRRNGRGIRALALTPVRSGAAAACWSARPALPRPCARTAR